MLHPNINSHLVLLPLLPRRTHHGESMNTSRNAVTQAGEWTRAGSVPPLQAGTGMGTEEKGARERSVVMHCLGVGGGGDGVSVACVPARLRSPQGSDDACAWLRCSSITQWVNIDTRSHKGTSAETFYGLFKGRIWSYEVKWPTFPASCWSKSGERVGLYY